MSRGQRSADDPIETSARTDEPVTLPDITAVCRDDDLVAALAARRVPADAADVAAAADDDAIRLLRALVADIDADSPALPVSTGEAASKPRRRRARAVVSLGVAAAVLTSTGVAAAGGDVCGAADAVSRFFAPADRPYHESRAELRRAREEVEREQYDAARSSLDKVRHKRKALRGPRANAVDKEISRLESRLPRAQPPSLPRPEQVTPTANVREPEDLQRRARSEAERRLEDIHRQWPNGR